MEPAGRENFPTIGMKKFGRNFGKVFVVDALVAATAGIPEPVQEQVGKKISVLAGEMLSCMCPRVVTISPSLVKRPRDL